MNWSQVLHLTSDALGIVLVIRLLSFRLHLVYKVFCAFVAWDVLSSWVTYLEAALRNPWLDYRPTWIASRVVSWVLSLWVVYALMDVLLDRYPSFRKFSRTFLNCTFFVALALAAVSARAEYLAVQGTGKPDTPLAKLLKITFITERSISTAASIVLVLTLLLLLWFPVQMPRNLAVFSIGFMVYFSSKTALLLVRGFVSKQELNLLSDILSVVLSGCYAYWILLIKPSGEGVPTTIGHRWNSKEQERLVRELETMNTVLARSVRN